MLLLKLSVGCQIETILAKTCGMRFYRNCSLPWDIKVIDQACANSQSHDHGMMLKALTCTSTTTLIIAWRSRPTCRWHSVARSTRQSEMADLARRATRWVGTCHTGMCMSNFMMIGWEMAEILHIEISRKHVSVTYDLDLWPKILKIFVSHGVPIRNMYAKFHNDRLRNGWDITLWNFAKTRTNTQTNRHGHYNTSPSPYGGRGNNDSWNKP